MPWTSESATMRYGADEICEAHRQQRIDNLKARVREATERWIRLHAELEEIKNLECARGTPARGWAEAALEDADSAVMMLLDQVTTESEKP